MAKLNGGPLGKTPGTVLTTVIQLSDVLERAFQSMRNAEKLQVKLDMRSLHHVRLRISNNATGATRVTGQGLGGKSA